MAGGNIDWTDEGGYVPGSVMSHVSRKQAAVDGSFTVEEVGDGFFEVQRAGGGVYLVEIYTMGEALYADCDCYDFSHYGEQYCRACVHIWRIYFYEDIAEL